MTDLILRRVAYGKDDTPEADREYYTPGISGVGTLSEWKENTIGIFTHYRIEVRQPDGTYLRGKRCKL